MNELLSNLRFAHEQEVSRRSILEIKLHRLPKRSERSVTRGAEGRDIDVQALLRLAANSQPAWVPRRNRHAFRDEVASWFKFLGLAPRLPFGLAGGDPSDLRIRREQWTPDLPLVLGSQYERNEVCITHLAPWVNGQPTDPVQQMIKATRAGKPLTK